MFHPNLLQPLDLTIFLFHRLDVGSLVTEHSTGTSSLHPDLLGASVLTATIPLHREPH